MPIKTDNTYEKFRRTVQQTQKKVSSTPKSCINVYDYQDGKVKILEVGASLHKKIIKSMPKPEPGADEHMKLIEAACKKFGLENYETVMQHVQYKKYKLHRPTRGRSISESDDLIEIQF